MATPFQSFLARSLSCILLPSVFVLAQVVPSEVPPAVVKEHGEQVVLHGDASGCELACASLAQTFPDQLYLAKNGVDYWDARLQDEVPQCRVEPTTAEEVSVIMKTLVSEQCNFAVKSGGHARDAGSSNVDGGVTIDLARMKNVEIAGDKKTAKVGAGARWGDVYTSVEKENLMVVGGRVADVGVGGLTLGGGISFFSMRRGWACDGVAAYEIVLADSTILNVTHTSHPDLYFALRGGSNNFGVVTTFTLEAFPQGPIWGGMKMYTWDKMPALLDAYHAHTTDPAIMDQDAMGYDTFGYFQAYDMMVSIVQIIHTKPDEVIDDAGKFPKAYLAYAEIESMEATPPLKIAPMSEFTHEIAGSVTYGSRNIYHSISVRPNRDYYSKVLDIFYEEIAPVKNITGFLPVIHIQPITPDILRLMERNGGNALGISGVKEGLTLVTSSWTWKDKADDEKSQTAHDKVFERATDLAREMGIFHPFIYQNYAAQGQDVFAGYGEENLKRLKKIQKSVDPDGVFARGGLCGGHFKINEKEAAKIKKGGKDEL